MTKEFRFFVGSNEDVDNVLEFYKKKIKGWKVENPNEFVRKSLELLKEIGERVEFKVGAWQTTRKNKFLTNIAEVLSKRFDKIANDKSPRPGEMLPQIFDELGINSIEKIPEEKIEELGWVRKELPHVKKVVILRKSDLVKAEFIQKIEGMKIKESED